MAIIDDHEPGEVHMTGFLRDFKKGWEAEL
jgi:hypothetical protein